MASGKTVNIFEMSQLQKRRYLKHISSQVCQIPYDSLVFRGLQYGLLHNSPRCDIFEKQSGIFKSVIESVICASTVIRVYGSDRSVKIQWTH